MKVGYKQDIMIGYAPTSLSIDNLTLKIPEVRSHCTVQQYNASATLNS